MYTAVVRSSPKAVHRGGSDETKKADVDETKKADRAARRLKLTAIFVSAVLLIISALGFGWGLYYAFDYSLSRPAASPASSTDGSTGIPVSMIEFLVALFAGGLGATVYGIRGWLKHACKAGDFLPRYWPWYLFRQIEGAVLALIFYLGLKAGILVLTVGDEPAVSSELTLWAYAAIGALVGMFSKQAIERLHDVFVVAFGDTEDPPPPGNDKRV